MLVCLDSALSNYLSMFTQCLSNHLRTTLHIYTSVFPTTSGCEIISSDSRMGLQEIATDSRTFYMHIQQCN